MSKVTYFTKIIGIKKYSKDLEQRGAEIPARLQSAMQRNE